MAFVNILILLQDNHFILRIISSVSDDYGSAKITFYVSIMSSHLLREKLKFWLGALPSQLLCNFFLFHQLFKFIVSLNLTQALIDIFNLSTSVQYFSFLDPVWFRTAWGEGGITSSSNFDI